MEFLRCNPTVFVVEDHYEIAVNTLYRGIICLTVGNEVYYGENSGVLSSEKKFAKIKVPQNVLNFNKSYTVVFKKTVKRQAYFSVMEKPVCTTFTFQPILKEEGIKLIHIADVHYAYSTAKNIADYFGNDTDLFVFNGDIGEAEEESDFLETYDFLGEVTEGKIPAIFTRGNHDARGRFAERFTEYFPSVNNKTFYSFTLGCFNGMVLDCGEDKDDAYMAEGYENPDVYGGTNLFHLYREAELNWLKGLQKTVNQKLTFAVSHISPVMTTMKKGDEFDIERDLYSEFNRELERLNVKFMLCGHLHRAFILMSNDERNMINHSYPVIFGSELQGERYIGTAITVYQEKIIVKFIDTSKNVAEEKEIFIRG